MTSVDAYVEHVRHGLAGMDAGVRNDIVRELRSHLVDSAAATGGDVNAATASLGDAVVVARRYRELYGYGVAYRSVFAIVAGILGVFTVPVLLGAEENIFPFFLSAIFLIVVAAFLIWVSVKAGNRAGLAAGAAGCIGRFAAFGIVFVSQRAEPLITPAGLALFAFVSLLLLVIGWVPGRAKRVWRNRGAEL